MSESGGRGLHHYVVNELGRMIAAGELVEDDQIVPEEIATRFGASRPAVREAIRVLEAKGMVRPKPRVGTRVLPLSQWNLLDSDVISWRILGPQRLQQLSELSDLRAAVEIHAAGRCAALMTPALVAELRAALEDMAIAADAGDPTAFTTADIAFHTAILDGSQNELFRNFAGPFEVFLHAREELHTLPEKLDPAVIEHHRVIIDAIEDKDVQRAEKVSRDLVEASRSEVEAVLGRQARGRRTRR